MSSQRWLARSLELRPARLCSVALGALAGLAGLALAPSNAQGQLRSGVASVALAAYAAPGVHVTGTVPADGTSVGGAASSLVGMTVNTAYRIELRGTGTQPVVLLRQNRAGLVPWEQVRALLGASGGGPVVLDIVVTPTL